MLNDYDDQLQQNIDQLRYYLEEHPTTQNNEQHLNDCKQQAEKIRKLIQQSIKMGNENSVMRYMKQFSQLNKRLQEMEFNYTDEHISLVSENQQENQFEVQIFEENAQQRKQRLHYIHQNLGKLQQLYTTISQLSFQQVEKMFQIEQNFDEAEKLTQKTSQELTRRQKSQKANSGQRIVIIFVLIFIIVILSMR